jgi:1-acyl-sn-glycerol-3-phosphate acyltransferase
MFRLRLIAGVVGFIGAVAYGAVLFIVRRDRSLVARDTARAISRGICAPAGIRVRAVGLERLEARRPCVYVANHQSYLDYGILARIYPAGTAVVGKREMARLPVIGWLFRATGNVLIDRDDAESALRTLDALVAAVHGGRSVWIFPEGTRGPGDGELLPFKSGAFRLAIAAGVPVVPVVVSPLKPFYDLRAWRAEPAVVTVTVLPPLETGELERADVRTLADAVRARMADVVRTVPSVPVGASALARA